MASFFQPVETVPGIVSNDTRFEVYWNATIAGNDLFHHWYQILVFALAVTASTISLCSLLGPHLRWTLSSLLVRIRPWLISFPWVGACSKALRAMCDSRAHQSLEPFAMAQAVEQSSSDKTISSSGLESIKSFGLFSLDDPAFRSQRTHDLALVCISNAAHSKTSVDFDDSRSEPRKGDDSAPSSYFGESASSTLSGLSVSTISSSTEDAHDKVSQVGEKAADTAMPGRPVFWSTRLADLVPGKTFDSTLLITKVRKLLHALQLDGVVLEYDDNDSPATINQIVSGLDRHHVPVVLLINPDADGIDRIDLHLSSGLIVKNASIMPDGSYRDYFRAGRVRDLVARAERQKTSKMNYFLGFIEVWEQQPSAAILRRAFKLADFFGAVIEARPAANPNSAQTTTRREICLSAFDWLKRTEIVDLQKSWMRYAGMFSDQSSGSDYIKLNKDAISTAIPEAQTLLYSHPLPQSLQDLQSAPTVVFDPPVYINSVPIRVDFWDISSCGKQLCSKGSFTLREEITDDQFEHVLRTQRHLKDLEMLHRYQDTEIIGATSLLQRLAETSPLRGYIEALLEGLARHEIKLYKGLDSGFNIPDGGGHLWGVSETTLEDDDSETLVIYLSQKASSDVATLLHVYLAHRGVPRLQRFESELILTRLQNGNSESLLPRSIQRELDESTEDELIYLLEQLTVSASGHPITKAIISYCDQILTTETTRKAWGDLHSKACLDRSTSIRTLLKLRLEFFASNGAQELPRLSDLTAFYKLLEQTIAMSLFRSDRGTLSNLSSALLQAYENTNAQSNIHYTVDLYGLMFFCALRRLGFDDVYLETTDRCPFFLTQHDQAGVFAELWVLGSQCEIYFGVYPRTLGEIIYDKYRQYLKHNPPPVSAWNGKDVFSAYSKAQSTIKIEGHGTMTGSGSPTKLPGPSPGHRMNEPVATMSLKQRANKLGALSIFCFPAIIDVCLLTFLGRGFYLTAFMEDDVRLMANYAILTALIMTAGITGWVGSTGGFYLFSFAFDNLTHFLVQRLSAAFVLTTIVAFCGFFAFGCEYSWYAGFIYVMYLYALTTFLNLLGIFATMHRLDCPLPSGRIAMWKCLPVVLLSPVITTFVNGWDTLIYLLIIYTFVILLLVTFRNLCREWTTWLSKIPNVKEKDVLAWYEKKHAENGAPELLDIAAQARSELSRAVDSFSSSPLHVPFISGQQKEEDPFVRKMAIAHPYAMWLLKKEAGDSALPETYTTTWFVQLELAVANQRQLTRALKEHSPFITYRYSRYDLGQNVGLFLAALMDRWIAISMSARKPQINLYYDRRARYAICAALLYFLAGAVAVDCVLQRYWPYAFKLSDKKLTSIMDFTRIVRDENSLRIKRYRSAACELGTFLLLIFGATTFLLWIFVIDHKAVILYFTSVSGYTGVLLFQFHRCFTKNPRAHILTIFYCCVIGFVVGCTLRAVPATADFFYDFSIGLNCATWPAAIGTFYFTGCFDNPFKKSQSLQEQRGCSVSSGYHGDDGATTMDHGSSPLATTGCKAKTTIGQWSCQCQHDATRHALRHLCLGIDVSVGWAQVPEGVRRLIMRRILNESSRLTPTEMTWLETAGITISNEDQLLQKSLVEYSALASTDTSTGEAVGITSNMKRSKPELTSRIRHSKKRPSIMTAIRETVTRSIYTIVQWIAIISGAAPDVHRELWFALRRAPLRRYPLFLLLQVWKACWWVRLGCINIFTLAGKGYLKAIVGIARHGTCRTLRLGTITINNPLWASTGFVSDEQSQSRSEDLTLQIYDGSHASPPTKKEPIGVAIYDHKYRLRSYKDLRIKAQPIVWEYTYDLIGHSRWPRSKRAREPGREVKCDYDKYGRVSSGNMVKNGVEFQFQFLFKKRPKGNSDILRATYKGTHESTVVWATVFWSVQPRSAGNRVENWTPSEKVQRIITTTSGSTYDTRWTYPHPRHPDHNTVLLNDDGSSTNCPTPAAILEDKFGFLKKPKDLSFDREDLLIYHGKLSLNRYTKKTAEACASKPSAQFVDSLPWPLSQWNKSVIYRKESTAMLRTHLWNSWGTAPFLDAVSACLVDEMILREEPLLHRYWALRENGRVKEAAEALDENLELIMSAIEPSQESTQTCPLSIKISDLFTMGLGKDANQLTARPEDAYKDTHKTMSVIFSDNGCWPDNPGGVSNCRRDLVNGHTTIRGHCLAESANDFGIPRYQIERNVNSLKVLPLWGLDGKTPYHGLLDNLLQVQVDEKAAGTRVQEDIVGIFIPLLKQFVRGARARHYTRADLVDYSNVVLQMNRYFEQCDFNKTWNSEEVWHAWIEAWLYQYDDSNMSDPTDFFEIEQPSMTDFREALNLYICYFFIYSVEIPGNCPSVFQSTHHGISSLYGMILKYRRKTTWGIWDHAILWRETCLNISPAQCLLSIPVQAMLLSGVKLSCHLAYTHVDVILPCTSVFNPDWERDLGTDQGLRGSRKLFSRKIDPIVNGIGNMDAFQPVEKIRTELPTTIMLSNVQFIKDVKNAVLAADIIINKYGFNDYRLKVYGAQDRQPSYALETTTIITERKLTGKVVLAGFGSPKEVLKDAWLFMNSSLSEGLPLAIGEAALSGVPIVATEVGATALVLTDPDDSSKRYGEVVPPNDPEALARAQLQLLAMLGPWAKYTTDEIPPPPLPDTFAAEDVAWITKRMHDKMEDRRKLGMKLREVVLRSFHGHRYLREHEQMYWIHKHMADMRREGIRDKIHGRDIYFWGDVGNFEYGDEDDQDPVNAGRPRWQDFDLKAFEKKDRAKARQDSLICEV